jgi:hypothetical protein
MACFCEENCFILNLESPKPFCYSLLKYKKSPEPMACFCEENCLILNLESPKPFCYSLLKYKKSPEPMAWGFLINK